MTASLRVGVVSCVAIPEPDLDQEPLLEALRSAGLDARLVAWDDPEPRFDCELYVLRSAWNYFEDPQRFLAWVERAQRERRILNPPAVVRWNHHKGYLRELEEVGIGVVPTLHVARGAAPPLGDQLASRGWKDIVVKPAISAGSFATKRFERGQAAAAQAFLTELAAERDVLVQPYIAAMEENERTLVWIDGELTHSISKCARFVGDEERISEAAPITDEEADFARAVLGAQPFQLAELLYARVDAVRVDGRLLLSELELIEPSLFLVQSPAAMQKFVAAIARRARGGD